MAIRSCSAWQLASVIHNCCPLTAQFEPVSFKASFKRRKTSFKLPCQRAAVRKKAAYRKVLLCLYKILVNRLSMLSKELCSDLPQVGAADMPDCLSLAILGACGGLTPTGGLLGAATVGAPSASGPADAHKWAGITLGGWQGEGTKFKFWREPTATVQLQVTLRSTAANPCSLG